jgi:hypothetical protein
MPIELLQGGEDEFDPEFRDQLPVVDKAMIEHNLDPSAFTITKDDSQAFGPASFGLRYHDYTVAVGDDSFTVTYPSDSGFLEFFLARCVAVDDPDGTTDAPNPSEPQQQSHASLIGKFARWFEVAVKVSRDWNYVDDNRYNSIS